MEDLFNAMTFEEAFNQFIKDKKVVSIGFRKPTPVLLSNGYYAYPGGYYTEYENGFKVIICGNDMQQEAMVLDQNDIPVGYKDQEFLDYDE